ncbi:MAG TPA: hypothetical protein VFA74_17295 [Terriglobales bacterium]|nr:hypothetical protein [Terriglobales bacterium]
MRIAAIPLPQEGLLAFAVKETGELLDAPVFGAMTFTTGLA